MMEKHNADDVMALTDIKNAYLMVKTTEQMKCTCSGFALHYEGCGCGKKGSVK